MVRVRVRVTHRFAHLATPLKGLVDPPGHNADDLPVEVVQLHREVPWGLVCVGHTHENDGTPRRDHELVPPWDGGHNDEDFRLGKWQCLL